MYFFLESLYGNGRQTVFLGLNRRQNVPLRHFHQLRRQRADGPGTSPPKGRMPEEGGGGY